jgi:hypothetical protein
VPGEPLLQHDYIQPRYPGILACRIPKAILEYHVEVAKLVLVLKHRKLPVCVAFSTSTMNVNVDLLDTVAIQAVYVDKHGKQYFTAGISVDLGYLALETAETTRVMAHTI